MGVGTITIHRSLKHNRWLSDTVTVLLAMHPVEASTWQQVHKCMEKFGWHGTPTHARVAISRARPYVVNTSQSKWQLTVEGRHMQVTILRDMGECIALARQRAEHLTSRHETVTTLDAAHDASHEGKPNGS